MSDRISSIQGGNFSQQFGSPVLNKIANGTGVKVFRCIRFTPEGRNHSSPWALKQLNRNAGRMGPVVKERLEKESEILRALDHNNIIKLKIVHGIQESNSSLNLEFGGEVLSKYLQSISSHDVTNFVDNSEQIITDIISALKYLHFDKNILHGDVKTDNVLYDQQKNIAKLCDFGVSLFMVSDSSTDHQFLIRKNFNEVYVGSDLYQPIEVRCRENCSIDEMAITDRCDVWAFGLLLYEMIALKPPYHDEALAKVKEIEFCEESSYDEYLEELIGTQPTLPEETFLNSQEVYHLFQLCAEVDYKLRPNFKDIESLWNSR